MFNKTYDWWLEWSGTAILILGVALTAWNVYPLNIWICLVGNAIWAITSIVWRKWSLLIVQVIISIIYAGGLVKLFME